MVDFGEILITVAVPALAGSAKLVWAVARWLWRRYAEVRGREQKVVGGGRPRRRRRRCPLIQPVLVDSGKRGELLADLVRRTGRVPLEGFLHPSRLRAVDRWISRNLFTFDTDPKPAFAIKGWKYDVDFELDSLHVFGHSTGFVLSFDLEDGESRSHLLRSLKPGISSTERLVAIAPPEALGDPTAWVRCLVVDAFTANKPEDRRQAVGVRATRLAVYRESRVFRAQQADVPDDALWLICRSKEQVPPQANWGRASDHSGAHPVDEEPSEGSQEHVDRASREDRWGQWLFWPAAGPGVVVLVGLVAGLFWANVILVKEIWSWLGASKASQIAEGFADIWILVWTHVLAFWLSVVVIGFVRWILRRTGNWLTKCKWRKRDKQGTDGKWTGGTAKCLLIGGIFRNGLGLDDEGWKWYWKQQDS